LTTAKEIKRSDSECFVDYSKVSSAGQCLSCSSDEVGSLEGSAVDAHEADAFPNSVDSDEDPFKRMSFAKTGEVRRLLNEIKGGISPQKIAIINQVIETITTSHLNTCNYTYAKVIAGLKKYEELKKSGQTSEDDLDPTVLWKHFQDNMVPVLQRVVNFFKKLPGFSEIEQEDQVKLFKQGSFEVILTRYTKLFTKDAMFVPNMTIFVPRNIIHQMPMGDFFQDMFKFAEVFNGLCLSDEEIGLLTAVMIVCPYRVGLANVKAVEELNLLFLQSLYTYMTRNRPDGNDELFDKTFQILSLIRDINEVHSVKLKSLKMSSPELSFPPLHEEVFDLVQCSQ
jgi:nuclear receptor subfamily 1 group D protein 3